MIRTAASVSNKDSEAENNEIIRFSKNWDSCKCHDTSKLERVITIVSEGRIIISKIGTSWPSPQGKE